MKRFLLTAIALTASGLALSKLPPPDDAAKAKSAETAARAAWQAKVDAYRLCQAQDRVVAHYRRTAAARPAVATPATPTAGASAPAAATAAAVPAVPVAAASPPPALPTPSNSTNPTTAAQGGGTPVALSAPAAGQAAPCSEPGPFAYTPPDQKPLESAGAHSPTGMASTPPNVKQHSAEMVPAKPSTASPPTAAAAPTPAKK